MGSSPAQTPAGTRNAAKPHPNPGHAKPAPRDERGAVPSPRERPWERYGPNSSAFPTRRESAREPPRPKHRHGTRNTAKPPPEPGHAKMAPRDEREAVFLRRGRLWEALRPKHRLEPATRPSPTRTPDTQNRPRAMSAGPFLRHGKGRGSATAQTAARFPRVGKARGNRPGPSTGMEPATRPSHRPNPATRRWPRAMSGGPSFCAEEGCGKRPGPNGSAFPTRRGRGLDPPRPKHRPWNPEHGQGSNPNPGHAKPAPRAERGAGPLRRDARENRPARSAGAAF